MTPAPTPRDPATTAFDVTAAARFAKLALDCVHRRYPNKIAHVMQSDDDVQPARRLTPVFYGCYDWHSAVHGHWLLVRLLRTYPDAPFAARARAALDESFQPDKVEAEVAYLRGKGRVSFERPYGLAWLLQLSTELHAWDDAQAKRWARTLEPLADIATRRFLDWFPKLTHPIRTGEHSQTAFAMGLVLDHARARGKANLAELVEARGYDYYIEDRAWNMRFEPGGQDFLSPGLAEADFMRRILKPDAFADWLREFLPELTDQSGAWIRPAVVTDKSDGKLAHLDGLNLSRAWMLEGIAAGLPQSDARCPVLKRCALDHRSAGLAAVTGEHYAGGHWLGSFAVYLVTGRGLGE